MNETTLARGNKAESLACEHLQRHGMRLLDRNYRCRQGEIDLIMEHGDTVVFVEVRYRRNAGFCSGAESIDTRKQRKLILAASSYLQHHRRLAGRPARFDVVSMSDGETATTFDWIQDAFQST